MPANSRTFWKVRATRASRAMRKSAMRSSENTAPFGCVKPKASGGRFVEAGDAVEHRGLAGAVRTDHRRDLAFARSEGNIVHGHEAAEAHGHVLDREDGRCGHCDVSSVGSPCSAAGGLGSLNVTEGARRETRPRGRRITTATMAAPNTSMRY